MSPLLSVERSFCCFCRFGVQEEGFASFVKALQLCSRRERRRLNWPEKSSEAALIFSSTFTHLNSNQSCRVGLFLQAERAARSNAAKILFNSADTS